MDFALLCLGVIKTTVGCALWRNGGRQAVFGKAIALAGGMLAALAAYLLLRDAGSMARYPALAVFVALAMTPFLTGGRAVWRLMRVELSLAGAAMAAIGVWTLVDHPSGLSTTLEILGGVLTASFIAAMLVRVSKVLLAWRRGSSGGMAR